MSDQHRRMRWTLRLRRPAVLAGALACALAGSLAVGTQAEAAGPVAAPRSAGIAKFLGVWNYRTPEPATGLDMAVVSGSGFSRDFPQVGWIDFTRGKDGQVTGTTDQGCTWQFALEAGELQLASAGQQCFNEVIGSKYQMNRWTVSVTGRREQEYIQATSFLPGGDYNFTLARGARTKVFPSSRDVAQRYAGGWTFNRANPKTGVNYETVVSPSGQASQQPVTGSVHITSTGPHSILAQTANGCEWKLAVIGNAAELAGAQTCQLPGGTSQTYDFWAMAVGPHREYAVMSGSNVAGGSQSEFSLATGLLTRS
jgi:hypothetical protein